MKKIPRRPLYITLTRLGGQFVADYAPTFEPNCRSTSCLSGYEDDIPRLLRDHPEFAGVPVIDLRPLPGEDASAAWKEVIQYPMDRLPHLSRSPEAVQPLLRAYLDHLLEAGLRIYPATA